MDARQQGFPPGFSGSYTSGYVFPPPSAGYGNDIFNNLNSTCPNDFGKTSCFAQVSACAPPPLQPPNFSFDYIHEASRRMEPPFRQHQPPPFKACPPPPFQPCQPPPFPPHPPPPPFHMHQTPPMFEKRFGKHGGHNTYFEDFPGKQFEGGYSRSTEEAPFGDYNEHQWTKHRQRKGKKSNKAQDIAKDTKGQHFRCDPCEKNFSSLHDMECHQKTHVQCEVKNCDFVASRKIVSLHFIQNHAEGKFRIRLLTTEDIEKWKEERRRNYPTLSNIRRKKEIEKNRLESGAVLDTTGFRYLEKMSPRHNENRRRGNKFRRDYKGTYRSKPSPNGKNNSFSAGSIGSHNDLKENAKTLTTNGRKSISPPRAPNALQTLLMSYESDESDNNEKGTVQKENGEEPKVEAVEETASLEKKNVATQNQNTKRKHLKRQHKEIDRQKNNPYSGENSARKRRPTLLEMLLAKDIRRERNIILQCVRHIVKSEFFVK